MHRSPVMPTLLATVFALAGCGGGPTAGMPDAGGGTAELLAPPDPGKGIQLQMKSPIAAGFETERCQFFKAPDTGINIHTTKVRYQAGSHHVLLYLTPYQAPPTKTESGRAIDPSGVVDCPLGASADFQISGLLAVAQAPDAPPIADYPDGVAFKVPPGAVLLLNTHYVNATQNEVQTDVRVNLYSIPDAEVKTEGGIIFFYNPFIRVPGNAQSSSRMACPVTHDITVLNLQNHMHRRGAFFQAFLADAQGAQVEKLYESSQWENVPVATWKDGKKIAKGMKLDYHCDYKNTESRNIDQGAKSTDEMCMLIGAYYPRDQAFSNCADPRTGQISSAANWITSGTKTCGETLTCAQSVKNQDDYFACVLGTCAASSAPLSAILQCQRRVTADNGECKADCQQGGMACQNCVVAKCSAELGACFQAACN